MKLSNNVEPSILNLHDIVLSKKSDRYELAKKNVRCWRDRIRGLLTNEEAFVNKNNGDNGDHNIPCRNDNDEIVVNDGDGMSGDDESSDIDCESDNPDVMDYSKVASNEDIDKVDKESILSIEDS
mgnify:CR=1 FL=1